MSEWKVSECRGCSDGVIWVVTRNRKKMPLNSEEVSRKLAGPKALLFEIRDPDPEIDSRTPLAVLTSSADGYLSHWATCDKREEFRSGR